MLWWAGTIFIFFIQKRSVGLQLFFLGLHEIFVCIVISKSPWIWNGGGWIMESGRLFWDWLMFMLTTVLICILVILLLVVDGWVINLFFLHTAQNYKCLFSVNLVVLLLRHTLFYDWMVFFCWGYILPALFFLQFLLPFFIWIARDRLAAPRQHWYFWIN